MQLNEKRFSEDYYKEVDIVVVHVLYDWFKPKDLNPYLKFLKSINQKKIILVGNYIALKKEFSIILKEKKEVIKNETLPNEFIKNKLIFENELENLAQNKEIHFLSFSSLCESKCKLFTKDKYPFSWDEHHLSREFIKYFVEDHLDKSKIENYIKN